tara:strand:- start:1033 stop:1518 length:486 start_codon:yes stop_codon:yes gene_type:complete
MTEQELEIATNPSTKLDEKVAKKKSMEEAIQLGYADIDLYSVGQEIVTRQDEVYEIVETALSNMSASVQLDYARDAGDVEEFVTQKDFKIDDIAVICFNCEGTIKDFFEEELEVSLTIGVSSEEKSKTKVYACNDCASTHTYRDFELRFREKQLPYTFNIV